MAITQINGEFSGDFSSRQRELARRCKCGEMNTVEFSEVYMIAFMFSAGLQISEHKLKILESLQSKPEESFEQLSNKSNIIQRGFMFCH